MDSLHNFFTLLLCTAGSTITKVFSPRNRQFMLSIESVCTTDFVPPLLNHIIYKTKINYTNRRSLRIQQKVLANNRFPDCCCRFKTVIYTDIYYILITSSRIYIYFNRLYVVLDQFDGPLKYTVVLRWGRCRQCYVRIKKSNFIALRSLSLYVGNRTELMINVCACVCVCICTCVC